MTFANSLGPNEMPDYSAFKSVQNMCYNVSFSEDFSRLIYFVIADEKLKQTSFAPCAQRARGNEYDRIDVGFYS